MSEKPHASQFTGSKLRRLFGLSGSDNHQHVSGPDLASGNPFQDCRRDLMERISAFLIKNNLDITPENLLCAHAAFTGANLRLARKIMERESAHEPITQEWLNSLASPEAAATDNGPDINRLVTKLETSIEAFTHTTRNAHSAGEEFVMLFRGLTKLEAKDKLDDAREALASRHFINRATDEPMGQITFSGGVADVFEFSEPRAALRAADEALYRAKEGGRNRIEMA